MSNDERPYAEWPTDEVRDARDELLQKVERMETELDQRRFDRSVLVSFFEEMEVLDDIDDDLLDDYLKAIRVRGNGVMYEVKQMFGTVIDADPDELDGFTVVFDETEFGGDRDDSVEE